jgi:poly(3-hydroxybutyrate) depolymerase
MELRRLKYMSVLAEELHFGASRHAISDGPTIPAIIFHGDRDTTVHPDNGAQAVEQVIGKTKTRKKVQRGQIPGGHGYTRTTHADGEHDILEHWNIHGSGHAWSGGSPAGSYTDSQGPDATKEMLRFFLENPRPPQPH